MKVIVDTKRNLVTITGLTEEQRNVILSLDIHFKLIFHWQAGKSGWCLDRLNWEQVCWLALKLTTLLQNGDSVLEALDIALEARIEY